MRQALVRGELGASYLGLAGTVALVALALATVFAVLRRPRRAVPTAALGLAWILAYSVVGGLNGLVGLAGFVWIRATSRNSIWILALVLLWGAVRLSRVAALRRHARASLVAAALATALTLFDQLPPRTRAAAIREVGSAVASDAAFTRSIESQLPSGAMLFLLPVVDYPEGPRTLGADGYDPLRLYLHSRSLRLSYGSDRAPREAWQRRVESLEPAAMADALERIGFSGVVINRQAYPDAAEELRDALAAAGRVESFESVDRDFVFVRLRPAAAPMAPDDVVPVSNAPAESS
jgi:phosphoglycerol transferase